MNKKYFGLMTAVLLPLSLAGCTPSANVDNLTWTNSNAVYASVKEGYEQEILVNVEDAFKTLSFEKIYVTEKAC